MLVRQVTGDNNPKVGFLPKIAKFKQLLLARGCRSHDAALAFMYSNYRIYGVWLSESAYIKISILRLHTFMELKPEMPLHYVN